MPNRLIDETSPYLLQHAHNPVDWYPWGPEAFEAARARNVPIFLSIGYSTCYWCHVMERESFEDPATAAVMNELFVCVKVDREERPDVDEIYMAATQMMTGGGGWPMSVFLEPETLEPFYCGTYFPPEPAHGRPSFTQVLRGMSKVWGERHDEVIGQAHQLALAVREHLAGAEEPVTVGGEQVSSAVRSLLQMFDRTDGGFGGAPKFPQPVYAEFLLDARAFVDEDTRSAIDHAVRFTLDRMSVGGLFDQVGGGFHRYCVDGTWTVPHFEKMLYDNAQLVSIYARAAGLYDDAYDREIVRRTLDYVLREMTGEGGRFFSAQDAEVGGHEGQNYLWTPEEVRDALSADDAAFVASVYGVDKDGNFRDPHHPEDGPRSMLRMAARPEVVAAKLGVDIEAFNEQRRKINTTLLQGRSAREQPRLDDKSIAAWNGMMIVAMVEGGETLGESRYIDAAEKAACFVLDNMRTEGALLARSWRDGKTSGAGVLEDQAWMVEALLGLHRGGRGDGRYFAQAKQIAEAVHGAFLRDDGAYADVAAGRSDLFVRARTTYDGATPSGSGVMVHALLDLAAADPEGPWLDRAIGQIGASSRAIVERPVAAVNATRAVLRVLATDGGEARLTFGGEAAGPADPVASSSKVVEIFADAERVVVSEDAPGEFTLGIRVKAGYHILAADPVALGVDVPGLVPLRVGLVSGQGVAVYADYPEGEAYGAAIVGSDELRVHTGELRLKVAIERAEGVGVGPGRPVLGVTFQACDDSACLAPVTVKVGVEVVVE